MSIRSKKTRSKTGSRRAHHGLTEPRVCDTEEGVYLRHRAQQDGTYRGKMILKTKPERAKKTDMESKTVQSDEKATTITTENTIPSSK